MIHSGAVGPQALIAPPAEPHHDHWGIRVISLVLVVAVVVITCWPTLHNGFLPLGFDDAIIPDTDAIHAISWHNLMRLATQFNRAHYAPLTMFSLAIDYRVWGLDPFGYHLTNILLHALTAALVGVFLWPLVGSAWVAACAAIVFAVHPVQMEAVSLAVQRKTLLSGALFFLVLIFYQRWCACRRRRWYLACLLTFVAASLAKPSVVTVPLLLLLYDYAFVDGRLRWMDKFPFFAVAALTTAAAIAAHHAVGAVYPPHGGGLLAHFLMVGRVLCEYVDAMLVPLQLSPIYYYQRDLIYTLPNFAALLLAPIAAAYVTLQRHRYPWSFFCLWWFLIVLLPESNVLPLPQLRADRFLYLPLLAFALWIALGFKYLSQATRPNVRWVGPLAASTYIAVLATAMATSAPVWHDDVSAWTAVVERYPWSAVAHGMLGRAYFSQNDDVNAERVLRETLQFKKPPADTHFYLAKLYAAHGMTEPAVANLHRYLELAPNDPEGQELLAALAPTGDS